MQREERAFDLDTSPRTTAADDTVDLYFLCARPDLSPASAVALNRAVAIGEADGPVARLADLSRLDDGLPRYFAVEAHLRERAGEFEAAAGLYAEAAAKASNLAGRDHLIRQAARLNTR